MKAKGFTREELDRMTAADFIRLSNAASITRSIIKKYRPWDMREIERLENIIWLACRLARLREKK